MMTVERFKFVYAELADEWELLLDGNGDYVDYADYQKLVAENATLEAENETLRKIANGYVAELMVWRS